MIFNRKKKEVEKVVEDVIESAASKRCREIQETLDKTQEEINKTKAEKTQPIPCAECKHLVQKQDMQIIELWIEKNIYPKNSISLYTWPTPTISEEFYCPAHKQNYDVKLSSESRNSHTTVVYYLKREKIFQFEYYTIVKQVPAKRRHTKKKNV